MPVLPSQLTFTAWQRSRVFERAQRQGARLGGKLALTLSDTATGQAVTEDAAFTLMAAADVGGLAAGAVRHLAPASFARDAETTKLVHVDLVDCELPWRYTPEASGPGLRPWLVLLVGTADELTVDGGIVTSVADTVLAAHDLGQSHLWAHVQDDGHDNQVARIVSPRGLARPGTPPGLQPQREHVAVLVPAFNDTGDQMWVAPAERHFGAAGILPALFSWRFWTAEAGDFETLAGALHTPPAGDVGKARLHYRRSAPGVNVVATLEVRGAITSQRQDETPQPDEIAAVRADLHLLGGGPAGTVGLPRYGRPWLADPDGVPAGWPRDLNDDPRFRSTAGLGAALAVEGQEALMDAAVAQAGALREAGQRIGHLALGLLAAGRLWDRRMPADDASRLRLLGPMTSRLPAAGGGTVRDRVTSGTSPLTAAQFSSAAQRILRDRSAATRHLREPGGGIDQKSAWEAANQPERPPDRVPAGLPHADVVFGQLGPPPLEQLLGLDPDDSWLDGAMAKLDDVLRGYRRIYGRQRAELIAAGRPEEIPALQQQLAEPFSADLENQLGAVLADRALPCDVEELVGEFASRTGVDLQVFCRSVLADDGARQRLHDWLRRAIRMCMVKRRCMELLGQEETALGTCGDLLDALPERPAQTQKPVDLGALAGVLTDALDPRGANPPAQVRVCSRLSGISCPPLTAPEFAIGLDFPTWGLLRQYDRQWLLPGADTLAEDSVTALQTNPAFVDAFLVGVNAQFLSEMRWRDLAVARTCTPLRMFWGQLDNRTSARSPDIQPIAEWAAAPAEPLGALGHQTIQPADAADPTGNRLVLVFRSALFRRYPATLVYLVRPPSPTLPEADLDALLKAPPELDMPPGTADPEAWRRGRTHIGPVFTGTLTPDLVFFTFDVPPSELDDYWLVLDEPPAELRFRNDIPYETGSAAAFAASLLDPPTRVAIDGAELRSQGLTP